MARLKDNRSNDEVCKRSATHNLDSERFLNYVSIRGSRLVTGYFYYALMYVLYVEHQSIQKYAAPCSLPAVPCSHIPTCWKEKLAGTLSLQCFYIRSCLRNGGCCIFAGDFNCCEAVHVCVCVCVCGHVCITPSTFVIFANVNARSHAPFIMEWRSCGSKNGYF